MIIQSINPATGVLIRKFESTSSEEIDTITQQARVAAVGWSELTLDERKPYFERLAVVIQNEMPELLRTIQEETGKLRPDGEAEIYDVIDAIAYYHSQMQAVRPNTSVQLNPAAFPDTDVNIDYVPYGVIALIMPWNFPFYSPMMFVIAAVTAGNTVVLKPSEHATLVGIAIENIFKAAGFPENVVQIVVGAEETGRKLVCSDVDKIFFVGSVEGGQDVIAHAAIKPVQVELGGNSAAIVLEDSDISLAANAIAWGGTYHSGQDCAGVKRVFVVQSVAEQFIKALTSIVKDLRPAIDYGPFITGEAMRCVQQRILDAQAKGAKLMCGGKILEQPGNWLTPSVLLHDDPNLPLVALETFGNTLPIQIVADLSEAIAATNASCYGLSASIYTKNITLAEHAAKKLQVGMVFINEPFVAIPGWDHWTGWKNSGFGTTESKLMQCLKKRLLSANRLGSRRTFWYPYQT